MNKIVSLLLLQLFLFPLLANGGQPESLKNGKEIYKDYCSVCHGDKGDGQSFVRNVIKMPPLDFTNKALADQFTVERMRWAILLGKPETAMPAWRFDLTLLQISDVITYIRKEMMGLELTEPVSPEVEFNK